MSKTLIASGVQIGNDTGEALVGYDYEDHSLFIVDRRGRIRITGITNFKRAQQVSEEIDASDRS